MHLDLSNNDMCDVITYPFSRSIGYCPTPSLRILDLSNNRITDNGADALSRAITHNRLYNLKHLELSGNELTETGQSLLASALQSSAQQDLVITLEKHSDKTGVLNFIKSAAHYVFEQHAKAQSLSDTTELALFGDLAYCKRAFKDVSLDVATGLIKNSLNPVRKLKLGKKIVTVGVFAIAAEEAKELISEDMAHCIATFNQYFGVSVIDIDQFTNSVLSGDIDSLFDI